MVSTLLGLGAAVCAVQPAVAQKQQGSVKKVKADKPDSVEKGKPQPAAEPVKDASTAEPPASAPDAKAVASAGGK